MEKEVGFVSNYFAKISVAAIEITDDSIKVGDTLHFKGGHDDIKSVVESIQIEHQSVTEAKKGDSIGLKVSEHVHKGDKVYKVTEE